MTSPIGLNRGYLFGIGQEPHTNFVYATHPKYPLDPFANPKLREAFDLSQIIVSDFEAVANEEELAEFFKSLPERLQKCLKPEDLQRLKTTLEPILDRIPGLIESPQYEEIKARIQGTENDAAATIVLTLLGLMNVLKKRQQQVEELSSERPLPETSTKERVEKYATLQTKKIVPLSSQGETSTVTEVLSLLMEEPELLRAILFALTHPDCMALVADANALERGSYDDHHRATPDMTKDKLMNAILSNIEIDMLKLMTSPVVRRLGELMRMPGLAERIAKFVKTGQRHIFFISPNTLDQWPRLDFPLTQIKIPLKPVGFFWTVRDDEGHVGTLMGSMHITAEKLVNFPRRIVEVFDSSDAMAVEIDVTREDVRERCKEVSWEKAQAKELDLLSPEEKEALFQFLKNLHPDIEADPTDEFDEQTQFIILALQRVALGGLKESISEVKDKATGQNFYSTGIEETLIKRAKEKEIPIKDLETFEDHFINFSSGSSSFLPHFSSDHLKKMVEVSKLSVEKLIATSLSRSEVPSSLDDIFERLQKHPLQKMTDMMESGDLDALEVSYLADSDPSKKTRLAQRNLNMASKISAFMKSGKKHFCIAGAMHMAGPSSVISFLKQIGYTVERLIVEEPLES